VLGPGRVGESGRPLQAGSRKALRKMLAVAEDVLTADGFDEFTMTAVAERAGVSVGAIYRRVGGKEQLLAAVIRPSAQRHGHRLSTYSGWPRKMAVQPAAGTS
jgi:AcrR family transcriptional regulator